MFVAYFRTTYIVSSDVIKFNKIKESYYHEI